MSEVIDWNLVMQRALRDTWYEYINTHDDARLQELDAKGFWGVMAEAAFRVTGEIPANET